MSTLEDRLARTFRSIDVASDFEVRLMARVHAEKARRAVESLAAARKREQEAYDLAGRSVDRWRRAALRMLSLDAVAGSTLLIALIAALPRLVPRFAAYGASYLLTALAMGVAVFFAFSLLTVSPFRGTKETEWRSWNPRG
jgi:hypothetical protein